MTLRVLIGCERSGMIRDAFRRLGADAWSVDLEECEADSRYHFKADLFDVIRLRAYWDILIVHPECTYLSVSGLHWNKRRPERAVKTEEAVKFARRCYDLRFHVCGFCMENPVSCLSTRIRKPDQVIQPYQFGDDASKATCLWLEGLPELKLDPAKYFPGRQVLYNGKLRERWSNQTDSGQNRLGPSDTRAMDRARTYPGIASAMASQWTEYFSSL